MAHVAVVGAGVIGLSTAIELLERGHCVSLISGQSPRETTSAVSAAYWTPSFVGDYERSWAIHTLERFWTLVSVAGAGVSIANTYEWLDEQGVIELDATLDTKFWWYKLPRLHFRRIDLPVPRRIRTPDGREVTMVQRVEYRSVVARMPDYLDYLLQKVQSYPGATVCSRWVDSLPELCENFDFVVNCSGWQSKYLVPEEREIGVGVRLIAGHVLRVSAIGDSSIVFCHHGAFRDPFFYIVPRQGSESDIICGGTTLELMELPPQREPLRCDDLAIYQGIQERCTSFVPQLSGARVLERLMGIRPVRERVRLEFDENADRILHHYGHGGSGMTLSWGSAADAAARISTRSLTP